MTRALRLLATIGLVTLAVALEVSARAQAQKSLYERLGGKAAIVAVVDDFVANCAADMRINTFFAVTAADKNRLAAFKNKLVDQICQATGGPCIYIGRSMKTTHAGLGITESDWDLTVKHLIASLDKFKVPEKEKNEFLALASSLKPDIVEKK